MYKRFSKDPEQSYFLFGPRGTGKSTWMREHYRDAIWIDCLDPEISRLLTAFPEKLEEMIKADPAKKRVVIDEIQRVPDVLTVVHKLIEQKKGWQFILTGSSARKLKRAGVDLLAGRALIYTMHPFMAAEMNSHFHLEQALQIGLLPLVIDSQKPDKTLAAYTSTYSQEEIQAEGLVRNLGNFFRFLAAISFSHASVLNVSNVARECGVERKTVEGYIIILEELLLAFQLQVFTLRAQRQLSSHPKFYLFDAGVYRSIRPTGPLDKPSEIDGLALEGLVAQHLRAWIAYSESDCRLFFWRTKNEVEVDFILYGTNQFLAIEVKNANKIFSSDLTSLKKFKGDYPECTPVMLYRGEFKLLIDNILCIPCEQFLKDLHPSKGIL